MKDEISTGYEGDEEKKEISAGKFWHLKKIPSLLHGGVVAQLMCDNEPVGILQLKDEEEFEWLRKRIDGTQMSSQDVELKR